MTRYPFSFVGDSRGGGGSLKGADDGDQLTETWHDALLGYMGNSHAARRQAETVTAWVRVGYVQGNMNSDNCLLSGRTMDYGPFGFVEEYSELWTPFTSDMEAKFGFERQPLAAQVNHRLHTSTRRLHRHHSLLLLTAALAARR